MKKTIAAVAVATAACSGGIDLSGLADAGFAEKYAFSTNRAELTARLKPNTKEWYVYSILDAQTSGRLEDAAKLLSAWNSRANGKGSEWDFSAARGLEMRQQLLEFDAGRTNVNALAAIAAQAGLDTDIPQRAAPLKPNTHPSVLDPALVTFKAFAKKPGRRLAPGWEFLALSPESGFSAAEKTEIALSGRMLPDAPGVFEALVEYLCDDDPRHVFTGKGAFGRMTLDQLAAVQKATAGTAKDVAASAAFADAVLARLVPSADADPADAKTAEGLLMRRLQFAKTLAPALSKYRIAAMEDVLRFAIAHDDYSRKTLFKEYLQEVKSASRGSAPASGGEETKRYLTGLRMRGDGFAAYAGLVEKGFLRRIAAEADLLAGKNPSETDVEALSRDDFAAILARVELEWSPSNRSVFAADDPVSLEIDVKNVPKMRVAVYELDAFEACVAAGGDVPPAIDLDSAAPGFERSLDFSATPQAVRHREKLDFPELSQGGIYVVECSGAGTSSRAVIRKGRLRVVQEVSSAGHVFTVFDDAGRVVPDAKIRVGNSVFESGGTGRTVVPFAASDADAGRKTAIAGAGRLAAALEFDHKAETVSLALSGALPQESFVSGRQAAALLRPRLEIAGAPASLSLLSRPRLSAEFTDVEGRTSVRDLGAAELSDGAETVARFTVPEKTASAKFTLSGEVEAVSGGRAAKRVSASVSFEANGIESTDDIVQLFMRNTPSGWILECRGRNGERIPDRAVEFSFTHVAFDGGAKIETVLQGDANGEIRLGALDGISVAKAQCASARGEWRLSPAPERPSFPGRVAIPEGRTLEFPVRGLFADRTPGAEGIAARISLLDAGAGTGPVVADCIEACSISNDTLRVSGLIAGDYLLTLRTENRSCLISVLRTARDAGDGRFIAGKNRGAPVSPALDAVRIESASLDGGRLEIALANASSDARVHVVASRAAPDGGRRSVDASVFAQGACDAGAAAWPAATQASWYKSGRDIGDTLRYILERRVSPARTGNMLPRPSLLLNPQETSGTSTDRVSGRDGDGWDAERASAESAVSGLRSAGSRSPGARASAWFSREFMPSPPAVFANLRPGADGRISLDVSAAAGMQDFEIVAVDGECCDSLSLCREAEPFVPRDLRRKDVPGRDAATAKYSTVAELYSLLRSIDPGDAAFDEFSFVAGWGGLPEETKRDLYSRYACHELDLFLYFKDRPFFDAVAAPSLANKRFAQFVDRWLLGGDVSAYAQPARSESLNAFEQCLLAARDADFASRTARRFADWCEENPVPAALSDRLLSIALAGAGRPRDEEIDLSADELVVDTMAESARAPGAPRPQRLMQMRGERTASAREPLSKNLSKAAARRKSRQFYRPPEKTKEWVETHYWKSRHAAGTAGFARPGPFWRDVAQAIASGEKRGVLSPSVVFAASSFPEKMAALAFSRLGFEPGGDAIPFAGAPAAEGAASGGLAVVQGFMDPARDGADKTLSGDFVKGRPYSLCTIVFNPSGAERRASVAAAIPEGAVALCGGRGSETVSFSLKPYASEMASAWFYFPESGAASLKGASVSIDGRLAARAPDVSRRVLDETPPGDEPDWHGISQNGSKGEVLAYLRAKNLAGIDLKLAGWRMIDGDFADKLLGVLESRGEYCEALWLAGFRWKGSFRPERVREAFSRRDANRKLAAWLGPAFESSLVSIDPEEADVFEHREYWPVINARAHAKGGADSIPNVQFREEYRRFLDTLAAKKAPSVADRLLASVYLVAQDRIEEAREMAAGIEADGVATKMQLDYLRAYFAFCDGDAAKVRALAEKWKGAANAVWRGRWRDALAQAGEMEGSAPDAEGDEASSAPAVSLKAATDASGAVSLAVTARNAGKCLVKAYPVDVEIAFSKNPFGGLRSVPGGLLSLKPAWTAEIAPDASGAANVALPREMSASGLVVVAQSADGRASSRIEVVPCALAVQIAKEVRQIRVRDASGRPAPGAYVKVYASDASGSWTEFHKDGYTDPRGAFDYASVSTDSPFKPRRFAVLVQRAGDGATVLEIPAE